VSKSL
jgi:MFS family permease